MLGGAVLLSSATPWNREQIRTWGTIYLNTDTCPFGSWVLRRILRSIRKVLMFQAKLRCWKTVHPGVTATKVFTQVRLVLFNTHSAFRHADPSILYHPLPHNLWSGARFSCPFQFRPVPCLVGAEPKPIVQGSSRHIVMLRLPQSGFLDFRDDTPRVSPSDTPSAPSLFQCQRGFCLSSWKCRSQSRMSIYLREDPGCSPGTWITGHHRPPASCGPRWIFSVSGPWLIFVSDVFVEKQNKC